MATETLALYGIPLTKLPTYRKAKPVGTKPVVVEKEVNFPLLLEMLKFIQENPQTWQQASWYINVDIETGDAVSVPELKIETLEEINSCGTSFCFAGHVALHEGFPAPPRYNHIEWERNVDGSDWPESVDRFATARLGLTEDQGGELFDGDNDLEAIEAMILALRVKPSVESWELSALRSGDNDDRMEILRGLLTSEEVFGLNE